MDVEGTVDSRFAPVRDVFETVLASQEGTGAAVAAGSSSATTPA